MDNAEYTENMGYIEDYFKGAVSDSQKVEFEKKIIDDRLFAEKVAFYIAAGDVLQQQVHQEKKQRFKNIYNQSKVVPLARPFKTLWRYMAAASVIIAVTILSWVLFADRTSVKELADKYVQQNWQTLGVQMTSELDSLQTGLRLFNTQKFEDAMQIFDALIKKDATDAEAKKYAGIASFRLGDFSKALQYFTQLENETALFSNPGKFYKAVTLLERNNTGDKEAAKLLLQQVIDDNLEGRNEAMQLIQKL